MRARLAWCAIAAFGCGSVTEDRTHCEPASGEYEKSWFVANLATHDDDPIFEATYEIVSVDAPIQPSLAATTRRFDIRFEITRDLLIAREVAAPVAPMIAAFSVVHHRDPCDDAAVLPAHCGIEESLDECAWRHFVWFALDFSRNLLDSPPRLDSASEAGEAEAVKYTPLVAPPEAQQSRLEQATLSTTTLTKVEWLTPAACALDFPSLAPAEPCPVAVLSQSVRFRRR